ncbi:tail assembly protein [Bordetella genomosp. 13]|uniref:tail assembly protein n=1 Tax=Bordetella genomosp. 13 TaxID=463040 RepID=UPI0011A95EB9|nr:tail assembly protein [Bordetella genomosp. 13]
MSESLKTVRLYGRLGAQFGRVHRLAVMSTAEAVQALCATVPGFERAFLATDVRYACFLGKRNIGEEDVAKPAKGEDIRIAPILQGAKRGGVFQTILGAALIVVGAVVSAYGGAGTPLIKFGAAMMFAGIVQMLSPQQRGLSTQDNPENGASYNFNGPVNTTAQGNAVPLLYGEMFVGSSVVSAGIFAEDQA